MAELALAVVGIAPPIIKYIAGLKDASKDKRELLMEVSSTIGILSLLTSEIQASGTKNDGQDWASRIFSEPIVEQTVRDLSAILEELKKDLQPLRGLDRLKHPVQPFRLTNIRKTIDGINACKQNLVMAMQIDHSNVQSTHTELLYNIDRNQQLALTNTEVLLEREYRREDYIAYDETMSWLSTYKHVEKHSAIADLRTPDTTNWIFEEAEFVKWEDGSTNTLFLKGGPGVGKSYLSSSIIDFLKLRQNKHVGLAYVYLNYNERGEQTVKNIICSFIKQLIELNPEHFKMLRKLGGDRMYKEKIEYITKPEAIKLLQDICRKFERVYLLIDAFDESESFDTQRELSDRLKALQDECKQTKLLITLRHSSSEYLRNFKDAEEKILQASDTGHDIVQYVKYRMRNGHLLRRNVNRKPSLFEDVVRIVPTKCAGMFLLARLHMDSLALLRGLYDFETRLGQLSDQIEEAYNDTVKRLYAQEEENVRFAEQILEWLLYAARPLKVDELLCALAVVDNDDTDFDERRIYPREDLEDVCKGLIVIEQGSDEVQFVHHTAQEHFKKRASKIFPNARASLSNSCIKYLEYSRFARRFSENRDLIAISSDNPLLRYAIDNFGRHYKEAGSIGTERIVRLLRDRNHHDCIMQVKRNLVHGHKPGVHTMQTPLWTATSYDLPKVVRSLLDKGENVNTRGCMENTPAHEAGYKARTEILSMLLDADPPPDLDRKDNINNILLHALAVGNESEATKIVLARRSDNINHKNNNGNTPLHDAAHYGALEVAQLLVEAGADLNISNQRTDSPIHSAINGRKPKEMVRLLLKAHHPNYMVADAFGVTPLHAAAACDFKTEIEVILKVCPEAIDIVHQSGGKTALHDAAEKGCANSAEVLISHGANLNLRDKEGRTALWWALSRRRDKIISLLLDAGADPSLDHGKHALGFDASKTSPDNLKRLLGDKRFNYAGVQFDGVSGLHHATWSRWNEIAILFLEHDLKHGRRLIDLQNDYGSTPLNDAAHQGNTWMVRRLLDAGADTTLRNKDYGTPLEMANMKGHKEIADIIRQYEKKREELKKTETVEAALKTLSVNADDEAVQVVA